MEKSASKSVAIAGFGDKCAITATFIINLAGNFLLMQLIYGGKADRSLPKVDFPKGFSLSIAEFFHQSIAAVRKKQKIFNEIFLSRVKFVRKELKLSSNFPALLVMDVFRGQMTKAVNNLLKDHNIFISFLPNNMTHIFQPLDLTVNSWAKKFMKEKYAIWYASHIIAGLEKGLAVDEIDVKTPLTTMKTLHAKWIMNLYDKITSEKGKEIILNGWKAARILDAVEMGSAKLKCLDPFNDTSTRWGFYQLRGCYSVPQRR